MECKQFGFGFIVFSCNCFYYLNNRLAEQPVQKCQTLHSASTFRQILSKRKKKAKNKKKFKKKGKEKKLNTRHRRRVDRLALCKLRNDHSLIRLNV